VDAFFPSRDELTMDVDDPLGLARALGAGGRLRWVAFKRAAEGGVLVDLADSSIRTWNGSASRVVDPTGAGDAFAGGFLAGWLERGEAEHALAQGSRLAALAVTDWGARALW
jgi:sugar/nucleoside kinase (ribokinase family)